MKALYLILILFVIGWSCKPADNETLTKQNTTKSPVTVEQPPLQEVGFVYSESGLNLRVDPDMKANTISTLAFGTKLSIIQTTSIEITVEGIHGKWIKVSDGTKEGYVFNGFVLPFVPLLDESSRSDLKAFMKKNFNAIGSESTSTLAERISETYTENYNVRIQKYDNHASFCNKSSEMVGVDQVIVPRLTLYQGYVLARSWMVSDLKQVNLGSKMTQDTPESNCAIIDKRNDYSYGGSLCLIKSKDGKINKITNQIAYEGGATTFTIKDTTYGVYIERYSVAD